ncbi:MAG: HAD hydrolase-like protein [Dongiaceae bacterium]
MSEPLPKAVLFDWDNTLVDNWEVIADAMNATLSAMGHPIWTLEETRVRIRASLRDSFPKMFGDRWPEAREIYYRAFAAHHLDKLQPMDGAADLLRALHQRGLYLGVVSNKHGQYLRAEAERLGWTSMFGAIVGAGDAAQDKPAPDPVIRALLPSGIAPGPVVWFVGDADVDMQCGIGTGCRPVLLRAEPPAPGEFEACPPALYRASCHSLRQFMETL